MSQVSAFRRPTIRFITYSVVRALVPTVGSAGLLIGFLVAAGRPATVAVTIGAGVFGNRLAFYIAEAFGSSKDIAKSRVYTSGYLAVWALTGFVALIGDTANSRTVVQIAVFTFLLTILAQAVAAAEPWSMDDRVDGEETPPEARDAHLAENGVPRRIRLARYAVYGYAGFALLVVPAAATGGLPSDPDSTGQAYTWFVISSLLWLLTSSAEFFSRRLLTRDAGREDKASN